VGKGRPKNFNRKTLFISLLQSLPPHIPVTVFLDKNEDVVEPHFTQELLNRKRFDIHTESCGSEAKSFTQLLNFIVRQKFDKNDIIVILEDDYKVIPKWHELIEEGLEFGDYVSLYDHPDKYSKMYENLSSLLFKGNKRHWRTAPSTTNSHAMKVRTLIENLDIHLHYSDKVHVTRDHEKFLALWQAGKMLVTCIPSAWSHEEQGMQALEEITKESNKPEMTYFS